MDLNLGGLTFDLSKMDSEATLAEAVTIAPSTTCENYDATALGLMNAAIGVCATGDAPVVWMANVMTAYIMHMEAKCTADLGMDRTAP